MVTPPPPVVRYWTTHVPTVPERRAIVNRQRLQLGPRLTVIPDPDRDGAWAATLRTLRHAWWRPRDATHVCILQDDAVLCPGFHRHLTRAVTVRPAHLVAPITLGPFLRTARERGDSWATSADLIVGTAWVAPLSWVGRMVRDLPAAFHPSYTPDDVRIAWWVLTTGNGPVWHTAPCLVEHGLPRDSLVGNPAGGAAPRTASVLTDPARADFTIIPDQPVHRGTRSRTRNIDHLLHPRLTEDAP